MKILLNVLTVCFILLSCQQKARDTKVTPLPKSKKVNVSKKQPFEMRVARTPNEDLFEMTFISDTFHISVGKVIPTIINHTPDTAVYTVHPDVCEYYNESTASWDDIHPSNLVRPAVIYKILPHSETKGFLFHLNGNEMIGRYRMILGLITPNHCNTVVGEIVLSADERFLKYNAKEEEETEKY